MRNILLFISIMFWGVLCYAQNWATVGAIWYYGKGQVASSLISYRTVTVTKDTLIHGKTCSKLVGNQGFGCNYPLTNSIYTYSSNDSIYFYDKQSDKFYLLLNFGATVGDTWDIILFPNNPTYNDTLKMIVDSVGQTIVDTHPLKTIYLTQINMGETQFSYMGEFIERIGGKTLFPSYNTCSPAELGIRCYTDSLISYHKGSIACDFTNLGLSLNGIPPLKVYPNPVQNSLILKGFKKYKYFKIYNSEGQLVQDESIVGNKIDVSTLRKGIYSIILFSINNNIKKLKFSKK